LTAVVRVLGQSSETPLACTARGNTSRMTYPGPHDKVDYSRLRIESAPAEDDGPWELILMVALFVFVGFAVRDCSVENGEGRHDGRPPSTSDVGATQ
jgi:hypothetical protein